MEEVAAALDAAKWKEIVTVESAAQAEPVALMASLDTQHGGLQWNRITDPAEVTRCHLHAKQWIMPMLNDERRNQMYYEAIQQALTKLQQQQQDCDNNNNNNKESSSLSEQQPIHVLDLGCGTGLLGFMAAKLCPTARITSVDMSSVMIQLAQQTLDDNKGALASSDQSANVDTTTDATSKITILEGHSTQMLPFRANLCVSELLEDGLLGEGWLPAIRDVWKRHLCKPNTNDDDKNNKNDNDAKSQKKQQQQSPPPIVIPCGATVKAQLIQGEWLSDYVGPRPYQTKNGVWIRHTKTSPTPPAAGAAAATAATADTVSSWPSFVESKTVVPMHVDNLIAQGKIVPLSSPVNLLDFDVSQADRVPGPEGRQVQRSVSVTKDGTAHAVLVWWDLHLTPDLVYSLHNSGKDNKNFAASLSSTNDDDENNESNTSFSSFQDHWHPCVHVLESPVQVESEQGLTIQARHDDYSIQVSLQSSLVESKNDDRSEILKTEPAAKRERTETNLAAHSSIFTPGRIWQLNQTSRMQALEEGIANTLHYQQQKQPSPSFVLDLSDYCVGALLTAATAPLEFVPTVHCLERIEAQAAVRAIQLNDMQKKVQVLQGHYEQVTHASLALDTNIEDPIKKNLLVVAEPSYTQLHYWPHLEALQLYYIVRGLYERLENKWNIDVVPRRAFVKAAAIESFELCKAYGPCDSIKDKYGLDHSHVINQHYGSSLERELSLPLWQYSYKYLSDPFEVATIPYNGTTVESSTTKCPFTETGICHGVVVWVEYEYAASASSDNNITVSTGPSTLGTRQLIYLWQNGETIGKANEKDLRIKGEMMMDQTLPNGFALRFSVG